MSFKDITGQKFGRLTVLRRGENYITPKGQIHSTWICQCDCEKHTILSVRYSGLVSGNTRSCGCLKREKTIERNKDNHKYNEYDLTGEYGIGYTSSGKEFYFDLEDYDKIKQYTWGESKGYIYTVIYSDEEPPKRIKMHNLLCPCDNANQEVDHLNRKKNDNRKANLCPKTHLENMINVGLRKNSTTGITGVNWREDNHKWRAVLRYNGVKYNLGTYDTIDAAIKARLAKEKELFGNEAPQSNLFKEYGIE